MNHLIQQPDGIHAEYGKTVNRFARTIKEGMEGFAQLDLSEEDHLAVLEKSEHAMRWAFRLVMLGAVAVIAVQLWLTA